MADPSPLPADVIEALQQGRLIDAIKKLRDARGLGLAEAKYAVEAARAARQGAASSAGAPPATAKPWTPTAPGAAPLGGLAPGEVPPGAGRWTLWLLVVALAVGGWLLLR